MNDFGRHAGREPLRCPSCSTRLVEVERSDVMIDACPDCRGVWLDRGELDKILVKERQLLTGDADDDFLKEVEGRRAPSKPQRPQERYDRDDDHHHNKKRKKRGFLEDLLDF